jgi:hypothetical protein
MSMSEEIMAKIAELQRRMEKYDEEYRKKIYPKLTEEQKKKRNLRMIYGKLYCDNLPKAREAKFGKEVTAILKDIYKDLTGCDECE